MIRKSTTEKGARKHDAPAGKRPEPPRPQPSNWEPIPLHVPQPEAPSRHRKPPVIIEDISEPRGVVIINYGGD